MKNYLKILIVFFILLTLFFLLKEQEKVNEISNYPIKPVKVIVAYKTGGGTDVGARLLIGEAQKYFPQPFVVKNITGSAGEEGYSKILTAKPDGYTIGFINLPSFINYSFKNNLKVKKEDVKIILNHVFDPGVLVVRYDSRWQNLEEFVEEAKNRPEALTVANNGLGNSNHVGAAHFAYEAGIELTHVPFGGSMDMITALQEGYVDATVAKISEVMGYVKSKEFKILASFTEERLEKFQDIPTLKEKGYDVVFGSARTLVAPKNTPDTIIKNLHDVFKKALDSEENRKKSEELNLMLKYMSEEEMLKYIERQEEYMRTIVPKLGI